VVSAVSTGDVVVWNVKNGKQLLKIEHKQPIRTVQFSEGDRMLLVVTERSFGLDASMIVYKLPEDLLFDDNYQQDESTHIFLTHLHIFFSEITPIKRIALEVRINCAMWGPLNKTIVCGCEDGSVRYFDVESEMLLGSVVEHRASVNKIAMSADKMLFITASADNTAKLFETNTLEVIKTFKGQEPLNTAAISPLKAHIAVAGGVQATQVTTTLKKESTFDVHFHHIVFEEELGKIKGHFGPVHLVSFSPDGKGFTSGGEDGIVRMHRFDKDYLKLKDEP
jgi:translation initiation factor 3 subunit I